MKLSNEAAIQRRQGSTRHPAQQVAGILAEVENSVLMGLLVAFLPAGWGGEAMRDELSTGIGQCLAGCLRVFNSV